MWSEMFSISCFGQGLEQEKSKNGRKEGKKEERKKE